ncbi:hypothetical protein FVE85_1384 [Porphyridium purpureum]|uniref:Uncharacterized protein n=1 Tax=Porphyridium purpureum TaxID=35688 RepID=A0A5J4YUQ4_PORPP|nr:hypothetical protein FVE85_1384 [Porphyridium purpureum]|eukprot:POR9079..scf209_3
MRGARKTVPIRTKGVHRCTQSTVRLASAFARRWCVVRAVGTMWLADVVAGQAEPHGTAWLVGVPLGLLASLCGAGACTALQYQAMREHGARAERSDHHLQQQQQQQPPQPQQQQRTQTSMESAVTANIYNDEPVLSLGNWGAVLFIIAVLLRTVLLFLLPLGVCGSLMSLQTILQVFTNRLFSRVTGFRLSIGSLSNYIAVYFLGMVVVLVFGPRQVTFIRSAQMPAIVGEPVFVCTQLFLSSFSVLCYIAYQNYKASSDLGPASQELLVLLYFVSTAYWTCQSDILIKVSITDMLYLFSLDPQSRNYAVSLNELILIGSILIGIVASFAYRLMSIANALEKYDARLVVSRSQGSWIAYVSICGGIFCGEYRASDRFSLTCYFLGLIAVVSSQTLIHARLAFPSPLSPAEGLVLLRPEHYSSFFVQIDTIELLEREDTSSKYDRFLDWRLHSVRMCHLCQLPVAPFDLFVRRVSVQSQNGVRICRHPYYSLKVRLPARVLILGG